MSDGIKAAHDDAMEELYNDRIKRIKDKTPHQILTDLLCIDRNLRYLNTGELSLTRNEHDAFDNIKEAVKELLS